MKLYFSITSKSLICKINAKTLIVVDYQIPTIKNKTENPIGNVCRLSITIQIYENGGMVKSVLGQLI